MIELIKQYYNWIISIPDLYLTWPNNLYWYLGVTFILILIISIDFFIGDNIYNDGDMFIMLIGLSLFIPPLLLLFTLMFLCILPVIIGVLLPIGLAGILSAIYVALKRVEKEKAPLLEPSQDKN